LGPFSAARFRAKRVRYDLLRLFASIPIKTMAESNNRDEKAFENTELGRKLTSPHL